MPVCFHPMQPPWGIVAVLFKNVTMFCWSEMISWSSIGCGWADVRMAVCVRLRDWKCLPLAQGIKRYCWLWMKILSSSSPHESLMSTTISWTGHKHTVHLIVSRICIAEMLQRCATMPTWMIEKVLKSCRLNMQFLTIICSVLCFALSPHSLKYQYGVCMFCLFLLSFSLSTVPHSKYRHVQKFESS